MKKILKILFFLLGIFADPKNCPDQDLGDLCNNHCQGELDICREDCGDASCETTCNREFLLCIDDCPCGENCENGCENCPSSFCASTCDDPENNEDYLVCKDKVKGNLSGCFDFCDNSIDCHLNCSEEYTKDIYRCPTGCPGCGDYNCESNEFIVFHPEESYLQNTIGRKTPVQYSFPDSDSGYIKYAAGVYFQGRFHVFGGYKDSKAILILNGCDFEKQSLSLVYSHRYTQTAIALQDDSRVLLCFWFDSNYKHKRCQYYDGRTVGLDLYSTQADHQKGCVGFFGDDIITLGSEDYGKQNYVEIRNSESSEWSRTTDFPGEGDTEGRFCLGVSDGLITIGGYEVFLGGRVNVHLFKNQVWTKIGELFISIISPPRFLSKTTFSPSEKSPMSGFFYDEEVEVEKIDIDPEVLSRPVGDRRYSLILDGKYNTCF
ncbi:Oidioi.mRNA.OKI2018_I69.chr1.g1330.t1.cds [Oikopleura dioica]|uniref:Oidioi.mRNA.OKI2018_I69.chr1.g1330.t1.cds n=1 Tax=Oikopleura dioica TaxID=34765 RepID=A0ABN7SR43_OIKDI|nr:Oidioi.mRNA.OKI2018_I69.chr1.g1330.t1.cds [Oikopleura dioica]